MITKKERRIKIKHRIRKKINGTAPDDDVENSMNGAPLPYVGLSEKAIRNRKLREKERERRHNRAKRKARRAKHGR